MSKYRKNPRRTSFKNSVDPTLPIVPHFWYPRSGIVAKGVLGLGRTQQDEKIASGEIPPPCTAFEGSREFGWFGSQLLEVIERRRARAQAATEKLAVESPPIRRRRLAREAVAAEKPAERKRRIARAADDEGVTA